MKIWSFPSEKVVDWSKDSYITYFFIIINIIKTPYYSINIISNKMNFPSNNGHDIIIKCHNIRENNFNICIIIFIIF